MTRPRSLSVRRGSRTRVEPRPGLSVWVEFRSGTRGTVDLSDIADATPEVAELWSDPPTTSR